MALCQVTDEDQAGAVVWAETDGQCGSPEREMEVTSQLFATAALQMRVPRKPLPPQTTSLRFKGVVLAAEAIGGGVWVT